MGTNSHEFVGTSRERRRCGVTRDTFRKNLADALRRRLAPNTGLTKAVLAHAIGIKEPRTIDSWMMQASQPNSYVMGELIAFFDPGFANEVYEAHGVIVAKLSDVRRAAAIQQLNRLAPALDALSEMVGATAA